MMDPIFATLQSGLVRGGSLYEDPHFPAVDESIYHTGGLPDDIVWKRPKEICDNPKFIKDGASRLDLTQGALGNCWFIAAAATLTTKPALFEKVVIPGQSFTEQYAGIFRFHIWRYGQWQEVVIDDQLPVYADSQELCFCRNRQDKEEFWGPLLEKAYAKVNGSYEALHSGLIRDALVDFTGGISETFDLRKPEELPPDLFGLILKCLKVKSLMGCAIWNTPGVRGEEKLANGLFRGHAYSLTHAVQITHNGATYKLLRLRNPWGAKEWTGAWGDSSKEWQAIAGEKKQELGLKIEDDGEFWISYDDWLANFHGLDVVHISPQHYIGSSDDLESQANADGWVENAHNGSWVKGVTAGGCGLFEPRDLYYINPQYTVDLSENDEASTTTVVISLMQKLSRATDTNKSKRLFIGFDVRPITKDGAKKLPEGYQYTADDLLTKEYRSRTPLREHTCRLQLKPGMYCIIPNTLRVNQEGRFLLRIFTPAGTGKVKTNVIDDPTGPIEPDPAKPIVPTKPVVLKPNIRELFYELAGDDYSIDATELKKLLPLIYSSESRRTFSLECCRCLISMADQHESGMVSRKEVEHIVTHINTWKENFKKYDVNHSGTIQCYELRRIFRDLGFSLSFDTSFAITVRYGGKDAEIKWQDFIHCSARLFTMFRLFQKFKETNTDKAKLTMEEWMHSTMYF